MATFSGEVLQVQSRAIDIDEEEDDGEVIDQEVPGVTVWWSPSVRGTGLVKTRAVIVAVGSAATVFTKTYILNQEADVIGCGVTGSLQKMSNTLSQDAPTDQSCLIYKLKEIPVVLVQCHIKILQEHAFTFVDQLMRQIDLSDAYVAVITATLASNFKGEQTANDLEPPFVRTLKSPLFYGTPVWPYLEQPNTMQGLPAQILTYCHVRDVPCVIYCCYTDYATVDLVTINKFRPLLRATPIKDVFLNPPNANRQLKKLVAMHEAHNQLYI